MPPLTHHEILALVAPFTRAGRAVDLAASDRAARRLVFRAVEHAGDADHPPLVETLELAAPAGARWRLTRRLTTPDGLQAVLSAEAREGEDLGPWLDALLRVPPARQVRRHGDGALAITTVLTQRLAKPADPAALVLQRAEARLPGGLRLVMTVSGVSGYPAELELLRPADLVAADPEARGAPKLPEDLLAVLGRPWDRLHALRRGWTSGIALRGEEPRRSQLAEERFVRTVEHLARTLAEPPARFHERHRRARWVVSLRGSVPLALGVALAAGAVWLQKMGPSHDWLLGLIANMAPPLLMGLFFMRREMPRIALPRIPRPPRPGAWTPLA